MTSDRGWVVTDLDGTLATMDVERQFLRFLIDARFLHVPQYFLASLSIPINMLSRGLQSPSLLKAWTWRIPLPQLYEWVSGFNKSVFFPQPRGAVVGVLEGYSERRLLLTGCHQVLAEEYVKAIDLRFDQIIGSTVMERGSRVTRHPFGKRKIDYLPKGGVALGIGNEFSDRHFLSACDSALVVPGDRRLEMLAESRRWKVLKE